MLSRNNQKRLSFLLAAMLVFSMILPMNVIAQGESNLESTQEKNGQVLTLPIGES